MDGIFDQVEYLNETPCSYSSNEMIAEIKMFDSTVEFIGFVDFVGDIEVVGKNNDKIFKCILNNGDGHRIQVKAWNENAERMSSLILSNAIIHLDGVAAKPVAQHFNHGSTVNFELLVQSNTIINCLGKHVLERVNEVTTPLLVNFRKVGNTTGEIKIEGYIKTTFNKILNKEGTSVLYLCGSITDGEYVLEIRIRYYTEDQLIFEKGEKVIIKGVMNFGSPTYLNVNSLNDVNKVKSTPKLPIKTMLKATKRIIKNIDEKSINVKKPKID